MSYIQTDDEAVADIVDKVTPTIIERYLNTLSAKEAVKSYTQHCIVILHMLCRLS